MNKNNNTNDKKENYNVTYSMGNGWIKMGDQTFSFGEAKSKNPLYPTKVIFNNNTTIVYFENGNKRVVTCDSQDDFDKEKGFLLALAHEIFDGKEKYRQMYSRRVDKKTYSSIKYNKKLNRKQLPEIDDDDSI